MKNITATLSNVYVYVYENKKVPNRRYIASLHRFIFVDIYEDIAQGSCLIFHAFSGREMRVFLCAKYMITKISTIYSSNFMRLRLRWVKRNQRYSSTRIIIRILWRS